MNQKFRRIIFYIFIMQILIIIIYYPYALHAQDNAPLEVIWEWDNGEFQRQPIAIENAVIYNDQVLLATQNSLFLVSLDGLPQPLNLKPPHDAALLALAPDGQIAAWIFPDVDTNPLYNAEFLDLSNLRSDQPAQPLFSNEEFNISNGISAVFLGHSIIGPPIVVTVAPSAKLHAIEAVDFTFLSEGRETNIVSFPTRPRGFLGGGALVVITDQAAIAYNANGEELWQQPGVFRNAVAAQTGELAFLNRADAINQVDVVVDAEVSSDFSSQSVQQNNVVFETPVFDMFVAPLGNHILITGDGGSINLIDLTAPLDTNSSGIPGSRTIELQCLDTSVDDIITNAAFITERHIALALLHGDSEWFEGSIIVTDIEGQCASYRFPVPNPTAFMPGIGVSYDYWTTGEVSGLYVVGFTDEKVFLLRADEE